MHSLVQFIIVRLLLIFIYVFSLKQLNFYKSSSHCNSNSHKKMLQ